MHSRKYIMLAVLISLLFTLFILYINAFWLESSLNGYAEIGRKLEWDNIESAYNQHTSHPVFAMRPLTSFFAFGLSYLSGLSIAASLLIIFFFFLFLDGYLAYKAGEALKVPPGKRLLALILFYLTFSILYIFAATLHTYDEPVQYAFLFLALIFFFKKKYFSFFLAFALSLAARETGLFLIPGFIILSYKYHPANKNRDILAIFLSAVFYIAFYIFYSRYRNLADGNIQYIIRERFAEWRFSFQNWQYAKESIILPFATLFPYTIIALRYFQLTYKNLNRYRPLIIAFFASLLINTPITFFTARVQETRILALPLVFIWPFLGALLIQTIPRSTPYTRINYQKILALILFLASIPLSLWLAFQFYEPTNNGSSGVAFQGYFFATLILSSAFMLANFAFSE